jgi:hypothetical protein
MTVEDLNELQQLLDQGHLLDAQQCAALLAEVWRFKTVNSSKVIEARLAREEADQIAATLNITRAENEALRRELEQLTAINGLPVCELETRWSNCAVRKRKGTNGGPHPPAFDPHDPKTSGA